MEAVLVYGAIFAALLGAAGLIAPRVQRALAAPAPWERTYLQPVTFTVRVVPDVDLSALPLAARRPFDRCWPGTDVPKAGL